MKIVILGSGMAGFGAAHRLNNEGLSSVIYEKRPHYGGRTSSYKCNGGFIFDEGPHVLFTKDTRLQDLFAQSVGQKYTAMEAAVNNYWVGHWIKHPAQCNLYGLPPQLVVDVLKDFIQEQNKEHTIINNYADWLTASYGKTFAETFPMQYTLKFHTAQACNMTTDWIGPRLYKPTLEEVLQGAISPNTDKFHYVNEIRYPLNNGFVSYFNSFLAMAELKLGHHLVRLAPNERELHFANGVVTRYDALISSVPLPELIPLISGVPADVVKAARDLACTSCVLVNIGVNREDLSQQHWTYFYDSDIVFTRLSFPHMMSQNNVPLGTSSIQAEVYFSEKYKPSCGSPKQLINLVIADLLRCGLLSEQDDILFSDAMIVPFAYVIFDSARAKALAIVHAFLDDIRVRYCGRYGEWGYLWADESFKSGENAAQRVLDSMNS